MRTTISVPRAARVRRLQLEALEPRYLMSVAPLEGDALLGGAEEPPPIEHHASSLDGDGPAIGQQEDVPLPNIAWQPLVEVGVDSTVAANSALQLNGDVMIIRMSDPTELTMAWSLLSGPGNAVFSDPTALNTSVQFDQPGTYELQLTGNHRGLTNSDSMFVTVTAPAGNQPALPELFDTTYALPTGGTTHYVNAGDDFQAALDAAQQGDVIVLEAGATFTGNFRLPKKVGDGWIYIISSKLDQLPADGRVGLEHAHLMPKLVAQNDQLAVIMTMFGAHHYRLAGIEVATDQPKTDLIKTGYGIPEGSTSIWDQEQADTVAELPHHITFDRMLVHSTSDVNKLRVGISLNGRYMAVINSYIANVKDGPDAQAIWSFNGDGPYKIVNNFLEATGENIMFGGTDAKIPNSVPSDIEIRGNHFYKRLDWYNQQQSGNEQWNEKNLLEFKNARRVLVDGNVFENSWNDAQNGYAIVVTPRNQSGNAPWSTVEDLTIQNNIIRNVGQGIQLLGDSGNHPAQQLKRVLITNNLMDNVSRDYYNNSRFLLVVTSNGGRPVLDLTVTHNLFMHENALGQQAVYFEYNDRIAAENFVFRDNIYTNGLYGSNFSTSVADNYTFENNAIILNPEENSYNNYNNNFNTNYPNNLKAAPGLASVGFVDYLNGNYRLAPKSPFKNAATDGTDIGPNFDVLLQAINGVVAGTLGLQSQSMGDEIGSGAAAGFLAIYSDGLHSSTTYASTGSQMESMPTNQSVDSSDLLLAYYALDPSLFEGSTNSSGASDTDLLEDEDVDSDEVAFDQVFGSVDDEMEFEGSAMLTLLR